MAEKPEAAEPGLRRRRAKGETAMRGEAADTHEFEIGRRFRRMMEARIARLEADAAHDEALVRQLENSDHIRRQMRLVTVQREEAQRMRRFLDQSATRVAPPVIAH